MSIPDSHPPAAYTMEDLTAASGVTARTVRYYIAEGLLPPPDGAGPATTYTDTHRNRLLLIGTLKDAYLPLKEIRRRIAGMRDDEIAAAVAPREDAAPLYSASSDADWDVALSDDAAAYLDRLIGPRTQPDALPAPSQSPPHQSMPTPAPSSLRRERHTPTQAPSTPNWKRLSITPEAELMIEEETYRRRQSQIEAALDWLRRILSGS